MTGMQRPGGRHQSDAPPALAQRRRRFLHGAYFVDFLHDRERA